MAETLAGVQRRLCKVNQIFQESAISLFSQFIPQVSMLGLLVITLLFQLISHFHRMRKV